MFRRKIRRHKKSRGKRVFTLLLCTALAYYFLWSYNEAYKRIEDEAPFDHTYSVLLKPFYRLSCPMNNIDKNCAQSRPIYLIHARPSDTQFLRVLDSWRKSFNKEISIINTYNMSLSYHNTKCLHFHWHQRLFYVYQQVFAQVLQDHEDISPLSDNKGFIFIEDDVLLRNSTSFSNHLCIAQQYEFYSFFDTDYTTCLYQYGSPAFYIKQSLMKKIVNDISTDLFCRLPFDMYIASMGPWYKVSSRDGVVVQHIGSRFHVS